MIVTVDTDKGPVLGTDEDGVVVFKGIPYAAAPTGALRWKAPTPAASWDEPKGQSFGPACPQAIVTSLDGSDPVGLMSEDCLHLNVWSTEVHPKALKPVMFWIHGGAFKMGVASDGRYSGVPLAKKGAVVVSFNYRLGLLGFFAHPALEAESPGGPVNFGLLDQVAALEWVRDNIFNFGGDPGNVTIFGQSAGAMSVLSMFAYAGAHGLFHKGIAQSPFSVPEQTRKQAVALGEKVARDLFGLSGSVTAEDLRGVDENNFTLTTLPGNDTAVPSLAPSPVKGDYVLPDGIRAAFEARREAQVPLIIGSTSDDASVLGAMGMKPSQLMDIIVKAGGNQVEDALHMLKGIYEHDPELVASEVDDPDRFADVVLRDMLFTAHARWIADKHAQTTDSWRYYFGYIADCARADEPYGVPHGGELVFNFGTGDRAGLTEGKFTATDQAMSDKVTNYWFSFAKHGVPDGGKGAPTWTKHKRLFQDRTLILGSRPDTEPPGDTVVVRKHFRTARLDIFIELYPGLVEAFEMSEGE